MSTAMEQAEITPPPEDMKPIYKGTRLTPADAHIGRQIRLLRGVAGFSQDRLGQALGLSFQQIQKYENGHNRCSAAMLWRIAGILQQPVTAFYEGLESDAPPPATTVKTGRLNLDIQIALQGCGPDFRRAVLDLINSHKQAMT